jgi:tellurite resistance protein
MSEHAALIYVMAMMAAADSEITDQELMTMGDIVRMLPVFGDFDEELLPKLSKNCPEVLNQDEDFAAVI